MSDPYYARNIENDDPEDEPCEMAEKLEAFGNICDSMGSVFDLVNSQARQITELQDRANRAESEVWRAVRHFGYDPEDAQIRLKLQELGVLGKEANNGTQRN